MERRKIQKSSVSERRERSKKFKQKPDQTPGKTPKNRSSVGHIHTIAFAIGFFGGYLNIFWPKNGRSFLARIPDSDQF